MKTPTHINSCPTPEHWTPEQALAVYDLLSELRDAIWDAYGHTLIESCMRETTGLPATHINTTHRDEDFDDEIPF